MTPSVPLKCICTSTASSSRVADDGGDGHDAMCCVLCVQRRRELRVCAVSSFLNAVVAVANPQPQRRQTWLAAPFHHTYHRNGEHSHLTLSDRPASPWPVPTVSFATAPLLCTLLPLQPLNLRYDIVSHTHTHTPAFRVGVQYDTARRIRHPATP